MEQIWTASFSFNIPKVRMIHIFEQFEHFDDNDFIIVCQFRAMSKRFFTAHEIHVDKTFSRAMHSDEIEFNTFDPDSSRST